MVDPMEPDIIRLECLRLAVSMRRQSLTIIEDEDSEEVLERAEAFRNFVVKPD